MKENIINTLTNYTNSLKWLQPTREFDPGQWLDPLMIQMNHKGKQKCWDPIKKDPLSRFSLFTSTKKYDGLHALIKAFS